MKNFTEQEIQDHTSMVVVSILVFFIGCSAICCITVATDLSSFLIYVTVGVSCFVILKKKLKKFNVKDYLKKYDPEVK